MTIYEMLTAAIAAEQPVAVATIVGGQASAGTKLLAQPDGTTLGALGANRAERPARGRPKRGERGARLQPGDEASP